MRAVAVVLLVLAAQSRSEAETFADILGTPVTRPISAALARSVGRALPLTSASAGVVYSFDPATGAFVRETSITGQLLLERADPVGGGRWNLSFIYQRVKFDTLEGKDIEHLSDTKPPIRDPGTGRPVTFPLFGISLDTHEFTASATCGVTDDLDVNLSVPVVYSDFRVRLVQGSDQGEMTFAESSSKLGVGDSFVRGKYRFLDHDPVRAALGLVLRIPSGNEDNFQGTGDVEVAPLLYVSTRAVEPTRWLRLVAYLNAGMNFDARDVGDSEGRWGVGLDGGVAQRATVAVAVLGRHEVSRIAPAGFFDVPRTDGSERPLFGLEGGRSDLYDFSVGGRVELWRDIIFGFANAIVPLNSDGVRADVIPTVGLEAAF